MIELFKMMKGLSSIPWSHFFKKAVDNSTRWQTLKLAKKHCKYPVNTTFINQVFWLSCNFRISIGLSQYSSAISSLIAANWLFHYIIQNFKQFISFPRKFQRHDVRHLSRRMDAFGGGLPDLPYFTEDPVFQSRSPATREKPVRETESPVFDYRLIQIGRLYKLYDSNLHHVAWCPKARPNFHHAF